MALRLDSPALALGGSELRGSALAASPASLSAVTAPKAGPRAPALRCRAAAGPTAQAPAFSRAGRPRAAVAARATAWGPLQGLVDQVLEGVGKLGQGGKGGPDAAERRALAKAELLESIGPLQRGLAASEEDREAVDELASRLEALNPTPAPIQSALLNGKWKLLYTTSDSILGKKNLPFLRPSGPIFQAIDTDTLQALNLQTWPLFNQVQATLTPVSKSRVNVVFDEFKILSLIPFKPPQREGATQAYLDTTYLDEDLRISRGNQGNLFILSMEDSSYRIDLPDSE